MVTSFAPLHPPVVFVVDTQSEPIRMRSILNRPTPVKREIMRLKGQSCECPGRCLSLLCYKFPVIILYGVVHCNFDEDL